MKMLFPVDTAFLQGVKKFFGGTEQKELVDPYFVLNFAGKEVQTRIEYGRDHPEYNQTLRVGLQVSDGTIYYLFCVLYKDKLA